MPRFDEQNPLTEISSKETLAVVPSIQRFGSGQGDFRDFEVDDLRAGFGGVRAWRHGLRVANGLGIFAAPPAVQEPTKNAHYMRMFVDSGNITTLTGGSTTSGSATVTVDSTSAISDFPRTYIRGPGIPKGTWVKTIDSSTQITLSQNADETLSSQSYVVGEGIGKLNAPMSDNLFITASGESPEGDIIMYLAGPKTIGETWRGYVDFWSAIGLMQSAAANVEGKACFENKGVMYFDTTSNKFRGYNGSAWVDLG